MNECPIRHKQFKSLRGMRSHHKEEDLIVEIDGDYWYSTDSQIERDNRKAELCSAMDLGVLRVDATELIKHFEKTTVGVRK